MKWIERLFQSLSERNALLAQIATLHAQVAKLQSQLPLGMHDCTIFLKECEVGHVSLSAKNWVQHPCRICEINKLKTTIANLKTVITNLEPISELKAQTNPPSQD